MFDYRIRAYLCLWTFFINIHLKPCSFCCTLQQFCCSYYSTFMHQSMVCPRGGVSGKPTAFDSYIREIVPKMWNPVGLPVPLTLRLNINRRIRHYKLTTTPAFLTAAGKLSIPDPMVAFTMWINVSNSLQRITLNIIRQSILKNIYL